MYDALYIILNEIDFEKGERMMIRKIAVAILLLMILVSCAAPAAGTPPQVEVLESPPPPTPPIMADIGDGGLLSGLPCAAPCVYGIRIGETQLDQVIPMLQQNGLSECYREDNLSWIGITCGYSVVVQVDSATSIVNGTGFYPSIPISLQEIIEKYGDPDFVSLRAEDSPNGPSSRISLFWDKLNMTVEMPRIESHMYVLEGTTNPEMVLFSNEEHYTDSSEIQFGEFFQRWNGYSTYQP
jgi:hypothetical protein